MLFTHVGTHLQLLIAAECRKEEGEVVVVVEEEAVFTRESITNEGT